jgi:rod shape-determining protein MreD
MRSAIIRHIFLAFLALASQIMLFRHLRIFGAETDVILILVIWLMSVHTRTTVLIFAAVLGLFQDALLDLWGLNMFSKVFIVMLFYNYIPKADEPKQPFARFFVIFAGITFFHNLVLVALASFIQSLSASAVIGRVLIGNTIFTTLTGSFIHAVKEDK